MAGGVSFLKFVGTVSLGLLTGVSASVSAFTLPTLRQLDSSSSASRALAHFASALQQPLLALTSLSAAPLFLSFVFSPRHARHPYLFYTSLLAVLSAVAPAYLSQQQGFGALAASSSSPSSRPRPAAGVGRKSSPRTRLDASYEVLGDVHSEAGEEDEQLHHEEVVNGEEVDQMFDAATRSSLVRTGLAAAGFAMSVVGIWGDSSPTIVIRA